MASKKILIQVDVTTKSAEVNVKKLAESMKDLEGSSVKVSEAMQKQKTDTGLNNAILLETGRLASDVSYGFSAIANNLGQLVTLFQSSAKASGGMWKAFTRLFRVTSLFIIGIQLLISFLPKIIKRFQDKAKALRAVNDAMIEGRNAVTGQTEALKAHIELLNSEEISLEKKERLLKKIQKEQGLENIELDENNVLSEESNKLLKEKIMLVQLEAQANVLKEQIQQELTKRAKDLDEIERSRNSTLSKATDFVDRNTTGLQNLFSVTGKVLKSTKDNFGEYIKGIPILKQLFGVYEAGDKVVQSYNDDVNSQEAVESRNRKAREESNKVIAESDIRLNKLIEAYKELTKQMLGLSVVDEEFAKNEEDNLEKLKDIQNNYEVKTLELYAKAKKSKKLSFDEQRQFVIDQQNFENDAIQKRREVALEEVDRIKGTEEEKAAAKLAINTYYNAELLKNQTETSEAMMKISDLEKEARLADMKMVADGLMAFASIAGEQTGAGKALAVAGTMLSTYAAAQKAYESQMQLTPDSPIRAAIAAATATAQGLARVKNILAVRTPAMKEKSVTGTGGGGINVAAPDFNVVGQGGVNQLGQVIGARFGQPIRAYVVSGDISSAQELERSITAGARLD
jgi:translation elongation factor EF-1beta